MIRTGINFLLDIRSRQRIAIALGKGMAMRQIRQIDLCVPDTWEFSGFSQNGEDGILDVLRNQLSKSNHYFIEIGSADGIENNTAWMLIVEQYDGIMIDGNETLIERAKRTVAPYNIGAEFLHMFVTREKAASLVSGAKPADPDVFSLDIDGNDYYIAKALLDAGMRPKIFVVEYNSVFGKERSVTIPYDEGFAYDTAHATQLYYGVSISGWRKLFEINGYRFLTVNRSGVNAFFVRPEFFSDDFINNIRGADFRENQYQLRKFNRTSEQQFKLIADKKLEKI